MNEIVRTSIKKYMTNVLYLVASAIRSLGKHHFLHSFAFGIKNDITSSETHNRMPAYDRIVNE